MKVRHLRAVTPVLEYELGRTRFFLFGRLRRVDSPHVPHVDVSVDGATRKHPLLIRTPLHGGDSLGVGGERVKATRFTVRAQLEGLNPLTQQLVIYKPPAVSTLARLFQTILRTNTIVWTAYAAQRTGIHLPRLSPLESSE